MNRDLAGPPSFLTAGAHEQGSSGNGTGSVKRLGGKSSKLFHTSEKKEEEGWTLSKRKGSIFGKRQSGILDEKEGRQILQL